MGFNKKILKSETKSNPEKIFPIMKYKTIKNVGDISSIINFISRINQMAPVIMKKIEKDLK